MIQPTNMQTAYPQQGGANAVSINIYNPQAYGGTNPSASSSVTQPQVAPYGFTNSLYQMPQASMYPMMQPMQNVQPQLPIYQMPQAMIPQAVLPQPMNNQVIAPTPQAMPESVLDAVPEINNTQVIEAPQAAATQEVQTQQSAPVANAAPVADPVVVEPQPSAQTVDVDSLVMNLKSVDPNVKGETINQIATYAQESPEIALQIVSEPIMQALVNVINEDTTALAGPTPEQIAVADKIAKGEQLTPQEDALAEQLSPRDMANKNRIFALYTLAMIQKLQRDELNQYIEAQKANGQETIAPLRVEDLIGYNDVVNVIKNDVRPEVKVAAIQALQHVVEPQDKATVEAVLTEAQASQDEAVKSAAAEAMAKFTV